MQKTRKRFKKFRVDRDKDITEYENILNDPLCMITSNTEAKETVKTFNDEGRMESMEDFTYFLVHWTEKIL